MSYIINKTDSTILTEIVDGSINQTATDLTLVGKNASTYGEFINENFVHILENFANGTQPNNPLKGQLWYDTGEARLKVYDGVTWKVSGGTVVANAVPTTIAPGDIWIDSLRKQMYFNDGTATFLAGPVYTAEQGVSGFQVIDVIDNTAANLSHTIVLLYVGQVLLGIFSKDAFTPRDEISGYSGSIGVGFNVSTYSGVKFKVPVGQAESLLAADGSVKTAESFMSSVGNTSTTGTLSLTNSIPLYLGPNQNNTVEVSTSTFQLTSNNINQNFKINMYNSSGLLPGLFINGQNQRVGLYTDAPTATLDVNGDTRVRGSLTVEGTLTTVSTTNIEITDKLIELGKVASPSNTTANGGGILLEGGSDADKTLTWVSTNAAWTSSENFNLAPTKGYYVNGFPVINQTTIGTTVTSAPGLTSVGTLTALQVDTILINDNVISYVNAVAANGDVILRPKGSGAVRISAIGDIPALISNVAAPVNDLDAVNKLTLTNTVKLAPLGLSINVGILSNAEISANILEKVYPSVEHTNGTKCRVWCIDLAETRLYTTTGLANGWSGGTVV